MVFFFLCVTYFTSSYLNTNERSSLGVGENALLKSEFKKEVFKTLSFLHKPEIEGMFFSESLFVQKEH